MPFPAQGSFNDIMKVARDMLQGWRLHRDPEWQKLQAVRADRLKAAYDSAVYPTAEEIDPPALTPEAVKARDIVDRYAAGMQWNRKRMLREAIEEALKLSR